MGQQPLTTTKRRRRLDYIKRKKEISKLSKTAVPVPLAKKVLKEAAEEAAEKKAPAKKAAAPKDAAAKKAPAKKAPAKKAAAPEAAAE